MPLLELPVGEPNAEDLTIAKTIAGMVPDGACLQMGVGGLPNAVCGALVDRKDLGIHSEHPQRATSDRDTTVVPRRLPWPSRDDRPKPVPQPEPGLPSVEQPGAEPTQPIEPRICPRCHQDTPRQAMAP